MIRKLRRRFLSYLFYYSFRLPSVFYFCFMQNLRFCEADKTEKWPKFSFWKHPMWVSKDFNLNECRIFAMFSLESRHGKLHSVFLFECPAFDGFLETFLPGSTVFCQLKWQFQLYNFFLQNFKLHSACRHIFTLRQTWDTSSFQIQLTLWMQKKLQHQLPISIAIINSFWSIHPFCFTLTKLFLFAS